MLFLVGIWRVGRVVWCKRVFVCLWLGREVDFLKSVLVCCRSCVFDEFVWSLGFIVWWVLFFFNFFLVCKLLVNCFFVFFIVFCCGGDFGFFDFELFKGGKFFFVKIGCLWDGIEIVVDLIVGIVVVFFCVIGFLLNLLFFIFVVFVFELFMFLCSDFCSLFIGVGIGFGRVGFGFSGVGNGLGILNCFFFICFFLFLYFCVNWFFLC